MLEYVTSANNQLGFVLISCGSKLTNEWHIFKICLQWKN